MNLSNKDYTTLERIQEKIILGTATPKEMKRFLNLIVKSGNELEMLKYMNAIGFYSIEEIEEHLSKNKKNEKLTIGLAIAGGAILLALLFNR